MLLPKRKVRELPLQMRGVELKRLDPKTVKEMWYPHLPATSGEGKCILVKMYDGRRFYLVDDDTTANDLVLYLRSVEGHAVGISQDKVCIICHSVQGQILDVPTILGPTDTLVGGEAYQVIEVGMGVGPRERVG